MNSVVTLSPAHSPVSAADGRQRWVALALLWAIYVNAYIDRSILSLLAIPIQADLGITDTQFGVLLGLAFVVPATLVGIPIGRVIDRSSRRNVIVICLLVWSAMTMITSGASRFMHLLLARIGVGAGEAGLNPAAYSLLADLFPRRQLGRALAIYGTGTMVGSAVAFLFGGAFVQWLGSQPVVHLPLLGSLRPWQAIFLAIGAPGFLFATLLLFLKEPRRSTPHARKVATWGELGQFLHRSRAAVGLMCLAYGLTLMLVYAFVSWMPTVLARKHHLALGEVGLAMGAVMGSAGLAAFWLSGWLADRWSGQGVRDAHVRVGFWASWGLLPFGALATLSPGISMTIVGMAGFIFCATMPYAAGTAGLQLIVPATLRGQVSAIFVTIVNLMGSGLGPLFVGITTDLVFADKAKVHLSLFTVMTICGILTLLCFVRLLAPFGQALSRQEEALPGEAGR